MELTKDNDFFAHRNAYVLTINHQQEILSTDASTDAMTAINDCNVSTVVPGSDEVTGF